MKTALIISSSVAASRVGATASAFCLQRLGVNTVSLPTTLLGRHPGWGPPGGGPTDVSHLESMWRAIQAQNLSFDAVMTGYMANEDHISLSETIIKEIKSQTPHTFVLVDPVMGDHGRLYVSEGVAHSIQARLLPLADLITPNAWELEHLTGQCISSPHSALKAAGMLAPQTVVTSVPHDNQIGAMYVASHQGHLVSHEKLEKIPHGGGDALAGTLLAHIIKGVSVETALAHSVASIFDIIYAARETGDGELPLVAHQDALISALPLHIETVLL